MEGVGGILKPLQVRGNSLLKSLDGILDFRKVFRVFGVSVVFEVFEDL